MRFPGKRGNLLIAVGLLLLSAAGCASASDGPSEVATDSAEAIEERSTADDDSGAATPSEDDESVGEEPAEQEPAADDAEASSERAAEDDDGQEETAMASSSPLGAFFADDGGFQQAVAECTARVEEQIVSCMAEQGFEFKPTGGQVNEVEERQSEMTEREWTTEYGYGISTSFDTIAQNRASDPNTPIVIALGAAEREIWFLTLFGPGYDDPDAAEEDGPPPLEEQGCIGQSIIATGGSAAIEGLDDFGDAYWEQVEAIFDRPELVDAVAEWSRCMAELGYPDYAGLLEPEEDLGERLGEITGPLEAALDELEESEVRALIEGDVLDLEALPGLDVDGLRSLQALERATAIADLDCYDDHVREIYEPLRDDFERGLMDTYSAELDALKNIGG
ncbi:MAG: hypothetical protein AAF567_23275 [Actinomycetota bacterium]